MKYINWIVPNDFNVFLFGDLHCGSVLCNEDGIKKMVKMAKSEYCGVEANYLVNHGDSIEAITIDDKRYDEETTKSSRPFKQVEQVVNLLKPVKNKIITVLCGNHEQKIIRNHGDMAELISAQLDVEYGTYTSVISYINNKGETLFKHFASHGFGSINSMAVDPIQRNSSMLLSLKRKLINKAGDCILMTMGHTHKLLISEPISSLYLSYNNSGIEQNYTNDNIIQNAKYIEPDNRTYVNTGAFYKLYEYGVSGYAERAGYNPIELGFAIAKVRNGKLIGVDKIVI